MAITLNYVTLDEFETVLPYNDQAESSQTVNVPGNSTIRNDGMVEQMLKYAESHAESYLTRYELPLTNPPEILKYFIFVITRYYLFDRGDGQVSEDVEKSFNRAISWLERVRTEQIDLAQVEDEIGVLRGFGDQDSMVFNELPFSDVSATHRNSAISPI